MLWIAALLSFIIWVLGWQSGFLGPVIHVFLMLALLAVLAALLPSHIGDDAAADQRNDQTTVAVAPPGLTMQENDTTNPATPPRR